MSDNCDSWLNITITNGLNSKYQTKITDNELTNLNLSELIDDLFPNCFASINNHYKPNKHYLLEINMESNCLSLDFQVKFNSFCCTEENIKLKEINYSNNQLTTNKINELEKQIKILNNPLITLGVNPLKRGDFLQINKNIDIIDHSEWNKYVFLHPFWILNEFQNATTLIIEPESLDYKTMNIGLSNDDKIGGFNELRTNSNLQIQVYNPWTTNYDRLKSDLCYNIFDNHLIYLPNIKKLIINCNKISNLDNLLFKNSMENIREIHIINKLKIKNYQIDIDKFIRNHNDVQKILISETFNITNLDLIKSYCSSQAINFQMIFDKN